MNSSEEQFKVLLANLAPRVDRALSQQSAVPPIGLILLDDGRVEVVLFVPDEEIDLSEHLNCLQRELIEKAREEQAVAACLSYPDYGSDTVVALLENDENYTLECSIPVVANPDLQLNLEGIEVGEGVVFVFGDIGP